MSLWTSSDIAQATNGQSFKDWTCDDVCMDSRKVKGGDVFFAIVGENVDGHQFVKGALEQGAVGAVVSHIPDDLEGTAPLIVVKDTLQALGDLGVAARERSKAKRIAVTGSVGKTTTKEMLGKAFGALGKTHASQGSYNNNFGVPFTLSKLETDKDYGIFEVGMNHSNEITPLSELIAPEVALITTVENVHLENFDGPEGIAQAKAEVFDGMTSGGVAVLNADNKWFDLLKDKATAKRLKVISFGTSGGADIKLISYEANKISAQIAGKDIMFEFFMPGQHMAMNAMGVLGCVHALGGEVEKAALGLKDMKPVSGRGEKHTLILDDPKNPITVIDESYNASPVATKAALKTLASAPCNGRRIFVLGDMYELGPDITNLHLDLKGDILAANVDLFFACGENADKLYQNLPEELRGDSNPEPLEIATIVAQSIKDGDVIMAKGSRGGGKRPRMYETIAAVLEKGQIV